MKQRYCKLQFSGSYQAFSSNFDGYNKSVCYMQVRRASTKNLKLGDDQKSLEMKVKFTQAEATAERLWKSRMMDLLNEGSTLYWLRGRSLFWEFCQ